MPLSDSRPKRKERGSSHEPPPWVSNDATFFVTMNCHQRGPEQLTIGDVPGNLFSSVAHYHRQRTWWPEIFLLMPDHLHMLVSFSSEGGIGMGTVLKNWKRYTARTFGIDWQRDYFDHRIRNDQDLAEKWAYIRDNPARKCLVSSYDQWPHVWFPDRVGWR